VASVDSRNQTEKRLLCKASICSKPWRLSHVVAFNVFILHLKIAAGVHSKSGEEPEIELNDIECLGRRMETCADAARQLALKSELCSKKGKREVLAALSNAVLVARRN